MAKTNISLLDTWQASGTDMSSFIDTINELEAMTTYPVVKGMGLSIMHGMPLKISPKTQTKNKDIWYLVSVTSQFILNLERAAHHDLVPGEAYPEIKGGTFVSKNANPDLTNESLKTTGWVMTIGPDVLYLSGGSKSTLLRRADLGGERAQDRSLFIAMAVEEAISQPGKRMTIVMRQQERNGVMDKKAFAFMSAKYRPIPVNTLPDVVTRLESYGTLGKPSLHRWFVSHQFARLYLEYPKAAADLQAELKITDRVIPGVMISTSNTGDSAFYVRGTYRVEGRRSIVTTDEFARRHQGEIKPEDIVESADREVFSKIRRLPEALAAQMGRVIGEGKTSTPEEREANRKAVKEAIYKAFVALGLRCRGAGLGAERAKALRDALVAEINPAAKYTECDISVMIMGLPDRVDGISQEARELLAKACGKAAFVHVTGPEGDGIALLPEE